jgi:hypothetical protein
VARATTSSNTVPRNTTAREGGIWIASTSIVAAVAISCFGACGSSDVRPPVPIDDLARLLADALCNNIGPCCEQAGFPHEPGQCHVTAETELRSEIEEFRSPHVAYDADAARACVDAYASVMKSCGNDDAIEDACGQVFAGTLMAGQTCANSAECVRRTSCQDPDSSGVRRCIASAPTVHGKLGDACRATCTELEGGFSCSGFAGPGGGDAGTPGTASCFTNDGLYCDATFTCVATPGLNEPCTVNTVCAGDAFCDNGRCAAKRTSGPCAQFDGACAEAAYCDVAAQQCQLKKSTGAPCAAFDECKSPDRCTDGVCRTPTVVSEKACRGDL